MYTTDDFYQQHQRAEALRAIARVEKRTKIAEGRIRELEWERSIYQAFGAWQTAIDLMEEQMIAWGRKEQEGGKQFLQHFAALLSEQTVLSSDSEWTVQDYSTLGKAHAYSEARYAVRFLTMQQAYSYLEQKRFSALEGRNAPTCSKYDALKLKAMEDELAHIITFLKSE